MKTLSFLKHAGLGSALVLAALANTNSANACADEGYIGSICMVASNFCPDKFAEANGALLTVSSNTALFSLLGNRFGGNGTTTFALPDLRGRSPVNLGQSHTAMAPVVTLGSKRGQETITLAPHHMTAHAHAYAYTPPEDSPSLNVSKTAATKAVPDNGDLIAAQTANAFVPAGSAGKTVPLGGASSTGKSGTVAVQNTGGGAPFASLSPQQALTACIRVEGLYPPRDN
jgi:microcystin-dependent protein